MTSNTKRSSVVPQVGPKPPVTFAASLTIADNAILTGTHPIVIGSDTVVHPRARLDSLAGAVTIGRRCVVEERTTVGAVGTDGAGGQGNGNGVTLGDYVTVRIDAAIEAGDTVVGDGSVLGAGAKVGRGAVVGKYCTIGPHECVAAGEVIPDHTIVFSGGLRRTDKSESAEVRQRAQTRHIEVLRKLIASSPAKFQS